MQVISGFRATFTFAYHLDLLMFLLNYSQILILFYLHFEHKKRHFHYSADTCLIMQR